MEQIIWKFCQENSDVILADGLLKLSTCDSCLPTEVSLAGSGNYLISHNDKPYYIGEAKDVRGRAKQQFRPTTSTFFKNFQKAAKDRPALRAISINEFLLRFIPTDIGRKEIEEFGIVNLNLMLNKFQIGKRNRVGLRATDGLWNYVQSIKPELIEEGEREVLNKRDVSWFNCEVKPVAGIYVVKRRGEIIYIGESSDIGERHITHSGTTYFSALRRHVGTDILGFELKERNGRKKYFTGDEDKEVTSLLRGTTAVFHPVSFGRMELEEHLIRKYRPMLNRKDNK